MTDQQAEHPTNGLSDVVHQRHRLGILTDEIIALQALITRHDG